MIESKRTPFTVPALSWEERREKRIQREPIVRAFLESHPVAPEDQIEQSMNEQCLITVLVPAYDETPETIAALLKSLANQSDMQKERFEVIVIINNDKSAAEQHTASYQVNQRTLAFLQALSHGQLPPPLSTGLNEQCQQILDSKLVFHVMDKTSPSHAFDECNVGIARDAVGREATRRFFKNHQPDGVLFFTDADCYFHPSVLSDTLHTFLMNAAIEGGTTTISARYGEGKTPLEAKTYYWIQDYIVKIIELLSWFRERKVQAAHAQTKTVTSEHIDELSGARMIVRMDAFAAVDGMPHLSGGEDTMFGFLVEDLGQLVYMKNHAGKKSFIQTTARPSTRTHSSHGYGWRVAKQFDEVTREQVRMDSLNYILARNAMTKAVSNQESYEQLTQRMPALAAIIDQATYQQLTLYHDQYRVNPVLYPHFLKTTIEPRLRSVFPPQPIMDVFSTVERSVQDTFGSRFAHISTLYTEAMRVESQRRACWMRYFERVQYFERVELPKLRQQYQKIPVSQAMERIREAFCDFLVKHSRAVLLDRNKLKAEFEKDPKEFYEKFFRTIVKLIREENQQMDAVFNTFAYHWMQRPELLPDSPLKQAYLQFYSLWYAVSRELFDIQKDV